MADDGLLLNFAVPSVDDFLQRKRSIKGGTWKDRLTARKASEHGRRKIQERAVVHEQEPVSQQTPRFDEHVAKKVKVGQGDARPKPAREVISSLFTYNPHSKPQDVEQEPESNEPIAPSNAPLDDELASFTKLGLSNTLAGHMLKKLEIRAPTAIQRKAVQLLCANDTDAFIQAETGSGKTLAYLLPIVHRISDISKEMKAEGGNFNREAGLFAVILAPTRELSKQISTVLEGLLSCFNWIVGGTVIGGESKQSEKARLRKGINILVATPGRMADHLDHTEVLDVSKVRWLVLDEGDRLMELGFENDIQKIVSVMNLRKRKVQEKSIPGLPDRRTTVLCSATIKADVEQLRSIALKDPVSISIDPAEASENGVQSDQVFSAPAQLRQSYALVPPKQRLVTLVAVLKQAFKRKGSVMKCIVFMTCADTVDFHFEVLSREKSGAGSDTSETAADEHPLKTPKLSRTDKIPQGNTISETRTQGSATAFSGKDNAVQIFRLHGSLQQATRTSTLKEFANCTDPAVLICTDVASRGLDLPNVDLVIEYDAPFSKDDHLHRVGRTARAGKEGRAMIFLQPGCEEGYVEILKEGRPRALTRHEGDELLKKGFAASSGVVSARHWEDAATDWQLDVERWALEHPKHLEQARRAFQSHIRAYATHVAAERKFFDIKQLHLGHLAKAFALRDKPGSIRVPGQRPGKEVGSKEKAARGKQAAAKKQGPGNDARSKRSREEEDLDVAAPTDEQEARWKMQRMSRKMGGVSEFNLG
nr:atp-dependent rna helicase dbp7 [Quercus suber]